MSAVIIFVVLIWAAVFIAPWFLDRETNAQRHPEG